MVHHKIQHHPHAMGIACRNQLFKILQGTISRVNCFIVRHIVLVVAGRRMNGHEPQLLDTQAFQIVHPADDALQVPYAVPIAVLKGSHKDFVGHA